MNFFITQFGEGLKYKIEHIVVKCNEPVEILKTKQVTVTAFPLVHRTETYGYLFKEVQPQLNVHKHLIDTYNLSLYEIARLKEGKDIERESSFTDENGELVHYVQKFQNSELTYKPYTPRSFAYCTDTMYFKRLAKWIENVDLIYHDSTYTTEFESLAKTNFHSTSAQAAQCAKDANAKRLILGHFSSRYKTLDVMLGEAKAIFENTEIAKEGMKFEVPLEKFKF